MAFKIFKNSNTNFQIVLADQTSNLIAIACLDGRLMVYSRKGCKVLLPSAEIMEELEQKCKEFFGETWQRATI